MTNLTENQFWKAVCVLSKNQHAIQRKLSGITIIEVYKIPINCNYDFHLVSKLDILSLIDTQNLAKIDINCENFTDNLDNVRKLENIKGLVIISKCILKDSTIEPPIGFQILNFINKEYQFTSYTDTLSDYIIKFEGDNFEINIIHSTMKPEYLNNWCNSFFKPKFLKWAQIQINSNKQNTKSLSLINLQEYVTRYNDLKNKYAKDIINIWPESTDPLKFVHEDVAIAAYLIGLWKETNTIPIENFVDLGCGNGVLVYILNCEGYNGYGIDIRRRKIWDLYPENVKLIEHTIIPNDNTYLYKADWIIGNHSDELSPWIPVITALSSYNAKFFLLPCCAFEFSGEKYQRRNSKNSIYNDFLEYVNTISKICDFQVLTDRLKIPSTKRIACIGIRRHYHKEEFENKIKELKAFLNDEINNTNIKLRNKIEIVQNCTQIDKNILNNLILIIFKLILNDSKCKGENNTWNTGGKISLEVIAKNLSTSNLKQIKAQCGGLKTLLKNNHEIFLIQNDKVQIKQPQIRNKIKKTIFKKRNCFFYLNHPNGCPLSAENCSFKH